MDYIDVKRQQFIHKLNIKPFGLCPVYEQFVGVYTSIKSTKMKFIPMEVLFGVVIKKSLFILMVLLMLMAFLFSFVVRMLVPQ